MLGCGRGCSAVGIVLTLAVSVIFYPVTQWDENVAVRTRLSAVLVGHVTPGPRFNLCSLLGLLTGRSQVEVSRSIMASVGQLAVHDSVKWETHRVAGVPVRLYRPADVDRDKILPVLIYYHGGGFVVGSIDSHSTVCSSLCNMTSIAIVSVEYRLAPEHVYPAAFEDAFAVVKAIAGDAEVAALLAINSSAVSIGGDSAGANLAAGVSLYMGRTDLPPLRSQVSVYPTVSHVIGDHVIYSGYLAPSGLSLEKIYLYVGMYIAGLNGHEIAEHVSCHSPSLMPESAWKLAAQRVNGNTSIDLVYPPADLYPYAARLLNDSLAPLLAKDLSKTPPTILILAGHDPVTPDGHLYAHRLKADGVQVDVHVYDHQIHAFMNAVPADLEIWGHRVQYPGFPDTSEAIEQAAEFVVAHSY